MAVPSTLAFLLTITLCQRVSELLTFNKLTSAFYVSVLLLITNIVKVTVDRRGVSRADPQTMRKFIL